MSVPPKVRTVAVAAVGTSLISIFDGGVISIFVFFVLYSFFINTGSF